MSHLIDGKAIADTVIRQAQSLSHDFIGATGRSPYLALINVGDDPASEVYLRHKRRAADRAHIEHHTYEFSAGVTMEEVMDCIDELNNDELVDGILVQLPLPDHIPETAIIEAISPEKDVDGFHPYNAGRLAQRNPNILPCTPLGCLELLKREVGSLKGLHAVIVGASNIVGRPMGQLLLLEGCTVTHTHRFTKDTPRIAAEADILVVAAGKAGLVTPEWVKKGAVVLDVGINRNEDGRIVGDVHPDVFDVAGAMTPVPGGVGPMTVAMLLRNTAEAALRRMGGC